MTVINNSFIESVKEGFAFRSKEEFGESITFTKASQEPRRKIIEPAVLANRLYIPDGPTSGHNALTIKQSNCDIVCLPECHSFAFPIAKVVARDLIDIYGWDKYVQSKIMFILQRTDVHPNEAHREHFGGWHSHEGERGAFDLTYQFSSRMGTEFKPAGSNEDPFILSAPTHALTRFGVEVKHRSPRNTTNETFSRSWGAFLVHSSNVLTNHVVANRSIRAENIDQNLVNGEHYEGPAPNVFSKPYPLTKIASRFINPELPDSLKDTFPNGLRYGFHSAVHGIYSAQITQTTESGLALTTRSFDGEVRQTPLPQDRWGIQCEMIRLGAHPIEPINA